MSEADYWSDFYSRQRKQVSEEPSTFATFVAEQWLKSTEGGLTLVDLGCGTARDSRFFARFGHRVIGVDQAEPMIAINNEKKGGPNETYLVGDFSHLDGQVKNANFLYSRFSVHSISRENASHLYEWAASSGLLPGGLFFIEARSILDPMRIKGTPDPAGDPDATICGHYRRYIRLNELVDELKSKGFDILYAEEGSGWSVCGEDDPVLVRVVARRR